MKPKIETLMKERSNIKINTVHLFVYNINYSILSSALKPLSWKSKGISLDVDFVFFEKIMFPTHNNIYCDFLYFDKS